MRFGVLGTLHAEESPPHPGSPAPHPAVQALPVLCSHCYSATGPFWGGGVTLQVCFSICKMRRVRVGMRIE